MSEQLGFLVYKLSKPKKTLKKGIICAILTLKHLQNMAMKPHPDMTREEEKAYIKYVFSNDLTSEERQAYRDWVSEAEEKYGCDASVVPIEDIRAGRGNEVYEKILSERAKREVKS